MHIDEPVIAEPTDFITTLKAHPGLIVTCSIAIILHIHSIKSPITNFGDEAIHLQGGLWVYDYLGRDWHRFLQILLWISVFFILVWQKKTVHDFIAGHIKKIAEMHSSPFQRKFFIALSVLSVSIAYFFLLKDISYDLMIIRYPPTSKLIYLLSYLFFGISHIGPRIIQLIFYILTAIYLYRTIGLFYSKDVSLIGASVYLFSPVVFLYSQLVETAAGTAFFMVAISYHFLRFLRDDHDRDLLMTTFYISAGFLFKRDILLMFFVCSSYLVLYRLINKNAHSIKNNIAVLLISLIPVIPWMITGKFFNWRNYSIVWSHFTSVDLISTYFMLIPKQVSWGFFILFIFSIIYVFAFRRDHISFFFGLLFITFYLFYSLDFTVVYKVHRFSVALYPAIAVFLAQFISDMAKKIKWKHSVKTAWFVCSVYLIILCLNPSASAYLLMKRTLQFPSEQAMHWVKDNVQDGEKILILRILPAQFYIDAFNLNDDKIINLSYEIQEFSTPESLKKFSREKRITYIMFPWNAEYLQKGLEWPKKEIFEYIRENLNHEFTEIARFNISDNYIFVYRTNFIKIKAID